MTAETASILPLGFNFVRADSCYANTPSCQPSRNSQHRHLASVAGRSLLTYPIETIYSHLIWVSPLLPATNPSSPCHPDSPPQ
ncbi:hypothetical protein CCHR01_17298 [Colletotrichum chrysophilum]|uniref:Uncharacterized protein n=1 Tax=Colletotrichum chrysophilum TaxID=1836956 RepID=A0AAD9A6V5_9PEZI|nr:hypothetical protein CCHR01_17298 [Colletotrichum chrysophilum]